MSHSLWLMKHESKVLNHHVLPSRLMIRSTGVTKQLVGAMCSSIKMMFFFISTSNESIFIKLIQLKFLPYSFYECKEAKKIFLERKFFPIVPSQEKSKLKMNCYLWDLRENEVCQVYRTVKCQWPRLGPH